MVPTEQDTYELTLLSTLNSQLKMINDNTNINETERLLVLSIQTGSQAMAKHGTLSTEIYSKSTSTQVSLKVIINPVFIGTS